MDEDQAFDAQREEVEARILALREEMEGIKQEFLRATTDFVAKTFQAEVEKAIREKPGLAMAKGVSGLSQLKADLNVLIQDAPRLVEERLRRDELWPDRQDAVDEDLAWSLRSRPERGGFDEEVRFLVGYVGTLLVKHGFADTSDRSEWEVKQGKGRYRFWLQWSDEMRSVLEGYAGKVRELANLQRKAKDIVRRKAEAQARRLWQQA